jgi:hypothetical protein
MKFGPKAAVFALAGLSFAWAGMSMLLAIGRDRKLGLTPSQRLNLLSGPRPINRDEAFIWRCALQLACALVFGLLCILALFLSR